MYETLVRSGVIMAIALLLTFLQPVYANGGHSHLLGGIFFLLLGGVVFFGGLLVVFYCLLRPSSDETSDESDYD